MRRAMELDGTRGEGRGSCIRVHNGAEVSGPRRAWFQRVRGAELKDVAHAEEASAAARAPLHGLNLRLVQVALHLNDPAHAGRAFHHTQQLWERLLCSNHDRRFCMRCDELHGLCEAVKQKRD
jgi:hypothetical protein